MARRRRSVAPDCKAAIENLGMQPLQAGDIVDVIPFRQHMQREPDFFRALAGLLGDAVGAPGDVLEQAAMREACSSSSLSSSAVALWFVGLDSSRHLPGAAE